MELPPALEPHHEIEQRRVELLRLFDVHHVRRLPDRHVLTVGQNTFEHIQDARKWRRRPLATGQQDGHADRSCVGFRDGSALVLDLADERVGVVARDLPRALRHSVPGPWAAHPVDKYLETCIDVASLDAVGRLLPKVVDVKRNGGLERGGGFQRCRERVIQFASPALPI
jgi:hypothetical protein